MSEMDLIEPGFTYSASGTFTKNKERIKKKLKKQVIQDIFIKMNLDKAFFQYGMAYEDFKYLPEEQSMIK